MLISGAGKSVSSSIRCLRARHFIASLLAVMRVDHENGKETLSLCFIPLWLAQSDGHRKNWKSQISTAFKALRAGLPHCSINNVAVAGDINQLDSHEATSHPISSHREEFITMACYSVVFCLFLLAIAPVAIQAQHQNNSQQDLSENVKKCVPLFDRHMFSQRQQQQQAGLNMSQRLQQNNANFSFQVGDIGLPLVMPAEGSIQSAMRLLSTFSSQFDQIVPGEEREEEGEEDGDGDGDGDEDERQLNVVKFRENKLHLSGLNLSMLNVHLYAEGSDPKFGIGITIKNTTLDGKFTYKGPLVPLTSTGNSNSLKGYYSMSIDNIYLLVSSNLTKVSEPTTTQQGYNRQQQHLKTSVFTLNVTNLGYISIDIYDSKETDSSTGARRQTTSNYVLKMLQKVLQRTIKRTYLTFEHHIRQALELEGRRVLDCELTRFDDLFQINATTTTDHYHNLTTLSSNPPPPATTMMAATKQGDLARVIDREIVQSGFSRVVLPDFEHQQSVFGSTARISFYNGSLSGLNTIKMIGETRIKLQDQHLIMNTSLGWLELNPYYSWNLTLGSGNSSRAPVSQGFVSFRINDFDFDAVITKGLQDESHNQEKETENEKEPSRDKGIVVEQLVIRHLETPKMDIGGLPGMNRLTRAMVNFFMGRLKQRLTGAIQPVLKQQLERSLNKLLM